MSHENIIQTFPFKAAAAMTATDYRFVKPGTTSELVDKCGAGEQMIGIRRNSPAVSTGVEVVGPGQIAKLTIGSGGVAAGGAIKSGADGEGIASAADNELVGAIALEAGDDGDVISVMVALMVNSVA